MAVDTVLLTHLTFGMCPVHSLAGTSAVLNVPSVLEAFAGYVLELGHDHFCILSHSVRSTHLGSDSTVKL
jgi:hypothetical protein